MGLCKDPALTYLNQYGYNVIKLPRAGVEPLDVLGRDEALERLGSLSEVWKSTMPVPVPTQSLVGDLEGKKSDNLDLGVGLKILANALIGMGAGVVLPALNTAYKRAATLQFKFTNVEAEQVPPFAIGRYLAAGRLDLDNPFVDRYFGNDETEEYIISEVLRSDSISVTAKDDSSADVALQVPALQGLIGASVGVRVGTASEGELVYRGKVKLTFGFKAYHVSFEAGKWVVRGAKPDEGLAFAPDTSDAESALPAALARGRMLRLKS